MRALESADNVGVENQEKEKKETKKLIDNWVSLIPQAKGKTREQIFLEYDNSLKAIAYIPNQYLNYFKGKTEDNHLYSGMAYFLDHAVNHHPEISKEEYEHIQDILENPLEIIIDRRRDKRTKKTRDNLLFTKSYKSNMILAVSLEEKNGKIVYHKSLYKTKNKTPYPSLPRVQGFLSGGGISPIGRVAETTPGGSLSARDTSLSTQSAE
ncbi:MAG: hypothetical protein Ta2G_06140 [Termitinemataceae bacterium]|nr:MAG: hypothetical protein Ta2G_06140 [Termitinemataceae bacterium]